MGATLLQESEWVESELSPTDLLITFGFVLVADLIGYAACKDSTNVTGCLALGTALGLSVVSPRTVRWVCDASEVRAQSFRPGAPPVPKTDPEAPVPLSPSKPKVTPEEKPPPAPEPPPRKVMIPGGPATP